MNDRRWRRVREVFGEALQRPAADRSAFVAEACGEDAELRTEIEALLESDATADGFLEPPLIHGSADFPAEPARPTAGAAARAEASGLHIDGYRILRQIHQGGQGVVYQAVQEGTGRDVAIKVLREGLFTGSRDRLRFDLEVRILGQLNHPSIVTIHDSGSVAGGFYSVMDYIRGKPLDEYVAEANPDIDDILRLFARICQAVNVAHLRGVIHRDLKPGNIRVDPAGRPHVLDFGLAKVADFDDLAGSQSGAKTVTGQFVGSVPWASPEQAAGRSDQIDLRTDVYSLGVLLYQMLTGRFPYAVTGSIRDTLENIQTAEPVRPASLRPGIKSEVETIVLKCLSKEPERRYQSAGALAEDIQRYLAGEPIEARRDSGWYVLRKSLARHHVAVTVACAFVLMTAASAIALGVLYRSARTERALAEARETQAEQARQTAEDRAVALELSNYFNTVALAQNAVRDENTPDLVRLLAQCPPRLRGWEWHYLKRQSDTSVRTLRGHEKIVGSVTFSPDGSRIGSGSFDTTIKLWDARTGAELRSLTRHDGWNTSVVFSPDGSQLAAPGLPAAGEGAAGLRIWDVGTGSVLQTLIADDAPVLTGCYAPDGARMATGHTGGSVKIWDIRSRRVLMTLRGHRSHVSSLAWMPGGRRLVSGSWDGTLRMWDAGPGECLFVRSHDDRVVDVAVHPDGKRIASASWDKTIRVWDASNGELLRSIACGTANPHALAFSPDGHHVAVATDTALKDWRWETERPARVRLGHLSSARCVAYSPDGRSLVSGGQDGTIRQWSAEWANDPRTLRGHSDEVRGVARMPGGRCIVSGGCDRTVRVWDAQSGEEIRVLRGHSRCVEAVAVNSDGSRIVSGGFDRSVRVWKAADGAAIATLEGPHGAVCCVAVSPDDRFIAAGSRDGTLWIWNAESGEPMWTRSAHADGVYALAYAPNGEHLLSGGADGTLKVWEPGTGHRTMELTGHTAAVLAVACSPDGSLIASGSTDRTIRLWDATTGRLRHALRGHRANVQSLVFSPDGGRLVSGGFDHLIKVWDVAHARLALSLSGHRGGIPGLAFSPDGAWFISASNDHTLRIWDTRPIREILPTAQQEHGTPPGT